MMEQKLPGQSSENLSERQIMSLKLGMTKDFLQPLEPEEIARRELGAQRLKELLSSSPYYKAKGEADPGCWLRLYESQVNR
jgi:hypothetical protein